jgi:hypothetical protein
MINVGIVSNNDKVAFNMASVVCKVGAHCDRVREYSFEKIKTFDIVVIDLDNIGAMADNIKKTSAGFKNIIVAGFSRNQEIMDDFRPLMEVKTKPFRNEHILTFIDNLKHIVKNDTVVNTEENPIYTQTGNPVAEQDPLNTDIFSNEEMSARLTKIINEKYHGPSEKQFLKQIHLDDVVMQQKETVITIAEPIKQINFADQFVDDALIMYRAKKLRSLRLAPDEIKNRVKALMIFDATHGATKDRINSSELEEKFDKSKKISDEISKPLDTSNNAQKTESKAFKEVDIDINLQREEAVRHDTTVIEQPVQGDTTSKVNNFTETELKYIKQSEPSDSTKNNTPTQTTSTKIVSNKNPNGIVVDRAELSKKVQSSMTPEQIEKLKKLGVKI